MAASNIVELVTMKSRALQNLCLLSAMPVGQRTPRVNKRHVFYRSSSHPLRILIIPSKTANNLYLFKRIIESFD